MVDVALHVEDGNGGMLGHLAHVGVALARHEIVADGDGVPVAREDDAHVARRLAVRGLRRLGRDKVSVGAELGGAGLEGVARARGLVEEEQKDRLVGQVAGRAPGPEGLLQISGRPEEQIDLPVRPVARFDVVLAPDAAGQLRQWCRHVSR